MKARLILGSFILIVSLTLTSVMLEIGCGTSFAQDKTYTIRLAEFYGPKGGGLPEAGRWWADEVEKRTGGKVKIQTGWSEAFGKVAEMPDLVRTGAVQMAALAPGYYAKQLPLWECLSAMPFVTYDPAVTVRVVWELYRSFPAMEEELVKNNIKYLYIGALNPYKFLSAKPIRTLSDMEGVKVRSWGTMVPVALKAVKAVPVSISVADAYDAFARGTVDVQVGPADMQVGQGWHELAKYMTHVNLNSPLAASGAINLDYWKTLPPDIQKVMIEVGKEHEKIIAQMLKDTEERAFDTMKKKGIEFIDFRSEREKWVKASPDFMEEWAKQIEGRGLQGQEFARRYREIMKKIEEKK
jgi:TRAP-type transport system periplasmic protein